MRYITASCLPRYINASNFNDHVEIIGYLSYSPDNVERRISLQEGWMQSELGLWHRVATNTGRVVLLISESHNLFNLRVLLTEVRAISRKSRASTARHITISGDIENTLRPHFKQALKQTQLS